MSSKQLAALALAATALAAGGCGSSSKTESTSTAASNAASTTTPATPATTATATVATGKPLSRTTWIVKGDAICAQAKTRLSGLIINSQQDYARALPQAAAYDRQEASELSKLVPPASKAKDWEQMLVALQNFAEDTTKAIPYLTVQENKASQPLIIAGRESRRQQFAIAKRNGFKVCSHS